MPNRVTKNRNGVSLAVKLVGNESDLPRSLAPGEFLERAETPASARIHGACEELRNLLLEDESEKSLLVGVANERLNSVVSELSEIEGVQLLFELWVDHRAR